MKKIWLIKTGEPLPIDGGNVRLYRMGMLAEVMSSLGYQITWWTSAVDHIKKRKRAEEAVVQVAPNNKIVLLDSMLYKRNVSLSRIVSHAQMARNFRKLSSEFDKPDIILCSLPIPDFCVEAIKYGKRNGVPVVIDIRDLWPDVFLDLVPKVLKIPFKALLYPMYRSVNNVLRNATAITGVTEEFVNWGIEKSRRDRTINDKSFPLGYKKKILTEYELENGGKYWADLGITNQTFNICFFGTLGRQFDIETIIEAAKILDQDQYQVKFIVCGTGDNLEYYRSLSAEMNNVFFPGWVGPEQIQSLMKLSSVGIAPYVNSNNFMMNIPNKIYEYISMGLPVLVGLEGKMKDFVTTYNIGRDYKHGDKDSLVEQILYLYNNRNELKGMSYNAGELYNNKYSADKIYSEMAKYLDIISESYYKNNLLKSAKL